MVLGGGRVEGMQDYHKYKVDDLALVLESTHTAVDLGTGLNHAAYLHHASVLLQETKYIIINVDF